MVVSIVMANFFQTVAGTRRACRPPFYRRPAASMVSAGFGRSRLKETSTGHGCVNDQNLTQRIVQRLGAIIDGAEVRHLPDAGHMLPLTRASSLNPALARHIARADERAGVPLALEAAPTEAVSLAEG